MLKTNTPSWGAGVSFRVPVVCRVKLPGDVQFSGKCWFGVVWQNSLEHVSWLLPPELWSLGRWYTLCCTDRKKRKQQYFSHFSSACSMCPTVEWCLFILWGLQGLWSYRSVVCWLLKAWALYWKLQGAWTCLGIVSFSVLSFGHCRVWPVTKHIHKNHCVWVPKSHLTWVVDVAHR